MESIDAPFTKPERVYEEAIYQVLKVTELRQE